MACVPQFVSLSFHLLARALPFYFRSNSLNVPMVSYTTLLKSFDTLNRFDYFTYSNLETDLTWKTARIHQIRLWSGES